MRDSVSLRDIYEAVNSLEEKISKKIDKQEERINSLENYKDRALGVIGVLTAFFSVASSYIWKKILGD